MRNSDAYNLGYQVGQAVGYMLLPAILIIVYFVIKRRKNKRKNDSILD